MKKKRFTYKKAGVDIDKADRFIAKIKPFVRATRRSGVVGGIGGFGALFSAKFKGLKDPMLVSGTDGVGTKLLVAEMVNKYDTVGIDLVAMCANDVLALGAEPLFFLDYLALGRLTPRRDVDLVKGIAKGCRQAGCALIGGETAELPGMYEKGKFDLAGFCVGVVGEKNIIDGRKTRPGDTLIGIQSSGLHSNGFSLARKLFSKKEMKGKRGKELLAPTKIYVKPVLKLIKKIKVKAIAHITGGGFTENIPRVIPKGMTPVIYKGLWPIPELFTAIQERAGLDDKEMFKTFNMGIGMVLVVAERDADTTIRMLKRDGLRSWVIGEITRSGKG